MNKILEIKDIYIKFENNNNTVYGVKGVTFDIDKGEFLVLTGETGCGKSVLCKSITGILPSSGRITKGKIIYKGKEISSLPEKELRLFRGKNISMIFQDPFLSLDPVMKIGKQIEETLKINTKMNRSERKERAIWLLEKVKLENPKLVYEQYPNMLSGGMRQRCVIAIALAADPDLLIADEPTTALDPYVQQEIADLLIKLNDEGMTILMVTHDIKLGAKVASRILCMDEGVLVKGVDNKWMDNLVG